MSMAEDSPAKKTPSPQYVAYLSTKKRSRRRVVLSQLLLLFAFFGMWEVAPRMHWINPLFTSYPSALWPTLIEMIKEGNLLSHTVATVLSTLLSFAVSIALGVLIAMALWWWEFLYRVLDPFLVVVNALPKIAFVPIFYIWLGPVLSIFGMAIAISLFVTIIMIYSGFRGVDPNKVKLAGTFGATRAQVFSKIVLPSSIPVIISTLKVNVGLSLIGIIVGEFQSANIGLGYLILYGGQIFKLDIVMTAIVILALFSGLMYFSVNRLEAAVMRRYV